MLPESEASNHQLEESARLWWLLVLADRLEVDLDTAFTARMDELEAHLRQSIASG